MRVIGLLSVTAVSALLSCAHVPRKIADAQVLAALADDLRCPSSEIRTEVFDETSAAAEGCGRLAAYRGTRDGGWELWGRAVELDSGDPLPFVRWMTRPQRKGSMTPPNPEVVRRAGYRGSATFQAECTVLVAGTVTDCTVLQSISAADGELLRSVTSGSFVPATFHGRAVPVRYVFSVKLSL